MIDFDLSDEQRLLEESVREWAGREVAPKIHDLDREHRFDETVLPQMAALDLLGISVPQEYGGAGMDYVCLGLASEELEYVDTSLRVIMSVHAGLNCVSLPTWGSEDQKRCYLTPQAQGKKIASYGLTEPAAGSDVRGIQSLAVKKGDRYFLTGEKMWILLAGLAGHFLVFAWTESRKKETARHLRHERLYRRARVEGILGWHTEGEVRYSRRQRRTLQDGRGRGTRGKPGREARRRLQGRDVRARSRALYGRRGRDGLDPCVPRRERQIREGAQDLRRRDWAAPAREGNGLPDGVRLPGCARAG